MSASSRPHSEWSVVYPLTCNRRRTGSRCRRAGSNPATQDCSLDVRTDATAYARKCRSELCRNCVRSPRKHPQTPTFTGSHQEAFCGRKSLNRLREEMFQYLSVSVAGFVFQACSFIRLRSRPAHRRATARCPARSGVAAEEDNSITCELSDLERAEGGGL